MSVREKIHVLLEKESIVELRLIGKNLGVKSVTTYKKAELLEKIMEKEVLKDSAQCCEKVVQAIKTVE